MPLRILESLQQRGTTDSYRYHANQHMRVFGSLLVGFAAFLALLPFLFALASQGIFLVELAFPDVNGILTNALVRCLLTSDNRHQP